MKRIYLILGLLLMGLLVAYFAWNYTNQGHEDFSAKKANYSLTVAELIAAYQDETSADERFMNQLIEVKGKVIDKQEIPNGGGSIILAENEGDMEGVSCAFESSEAFQGISAGDIVSIKGECTGKLMDVNLVRSVITSQH